MSTSTTLLALGFGLVTAGCAWLQWTGRWTSWARNPVFRHGGFPVMVFCAALGLSSAAAGVLPDPLGGIALGVGVLVMIPAFVLTVWGPAWAGPPWFRALDGDGPDPLDWMSAPLVKRETPDLGWHGSRNQATMHHRDEVPVVGFEAQLVGDEFGRPSVYQRRGMVIGELTLYPSGLVFAASEDEDRFRKEATLREVPAASVRGVERWRAGRDADGHRQRASDLWQRVIPRVRIDTDDGPLVFQCRRAKELIAAVEEQYLGAAVR